MVAGQSAPRYESIAHLYRRSTRLSQQLSNYFIIIVQTCHQFVKFSQRSLLSQLALSLDDSKILNAQSSLERWARQIQDEVSFLTTETVEDEAADNGMFRAMVSKAYSWESHQRKFRLRAQLLEALSTMDHETPYKQARQCGVSTIFQNNSVFNDWRDEDFSASLILAGKLGSGKSVTMANIIDSLLLSDNGYKVAYVFCRHDDVNSLTARAVIGSLSRQLVMRFFDDSLLTNVEDGCQTILSLADVFRIIKSVVPTDVPIHFILDGIDEMPEHEAVEVVKALKDLQAHMRLIICGSIRSAVQDYSSLFAPLANLNIFPMPEENLDISNFIDEELQRRMEGKQLILGNEEIILEIRESLIKGANGMFLWVALQIDSLCEEKSDSAIRRALKDLPPDLFTTFSRILDRPKASSRAYQRRILELIVAAQRPLLVDELREAISVAPGEITWNPDDLINDIYGVLECCGSLVVVDGENLAVRLIHQSVAQFLLTPHTAGAGSSPRLHFTSEQAHRYMGECAVTYLNYSLFETRITSQVAHEVKVGSLPSHIINEALVPAGMFGQLAMMLLKPNTTPEFDAKRALIEAASRQRRQRSPQISHFLTYAARYWLRHTTWMTEKSAFRNLWVQLLENPRFNHLTWTEGSASRDALIVDSDTGFIWQFSERVMWAIANSHIPLLKYEMKGKGWWKAFCTVVPYLRRCLSCKPRLHISAEMCTQLLPLVASFKSVGLLEWLCSMGAALPFDLEAGWPGTLSDSNYFITRAFLSQNESHITGFRSWPLLEFAVERGDIKMVEVLVRHEHTMPLEKVFAGDVFNPAVVRIIYHLLQGNSDFENPDWDQLIVSMKILHCALNEKYFDVVREIVRKLKVSLSASELERILQKAMMRYCIFQDDNLVNTLLPFYLRYGNDSKRISLILAALHSRSPGRIALAQKLWDNFTCIRIDRPTPNIMWTRYPDISQKVVFRCLQLREWGLATLIFEYERKNVINNTSNDWASEIRQYARDIDLLHFCADASDHEGIEFLKTQANYRLDSLAVNVSQCFRFQTPLDAVFRAEFNDRASLTRLQNTAELLLDDEAYALQLAFPFEPFAIFLGNVCGLLKATSPNKQTELALSVELGGIMTSMLVRSKAVNKLYFKEAAQGLLWSLLTQYLQGPSSKSPIGTTRSRRSLDFLYELIRQVLHFNLSLNQEIVDLVSNSHATMDSRLRGLLNQQQQHPHGQQHANIPDKDGDVTSNSKDLGSPSQ